MFQDIRQVWAKINSLDKAVKYIYCKIKDGGGGSSPSSDTLSDVVARGNIAGGNIDMGDSESMPGISNAIYYKNNPSVMPGGEDGSGILFMDQENTVNAINVLTQLNDRRSAMLVSTMGSAMTFSIEEDGVSKTAMIGVSDDPSVDGDHPRVRVTYSGSDDNVDAIGIMGDRDYSNNYFNFDEYSYEDDIYKVNESRSFFAQVGWVQDYVKENSSGSQGLYVPMDGTTTADPFRGDFVMGSSNPTIYGYSDNTSFILNNLGFYNTALIGDVDYSVTISPQNGISLTSQGDNTTEIIINSINGIDSNKYYGALYGSLSYIQKQYVDDNYLNTVSETSQTITSPLTLSDQLTYNAPLTTDVFSVLVKDSSNQIKSATSVNIIDIWESSSFPTDIQLSTNFPNAAMVTCPNTTVRGFYIRIGAFWEFFASTLIPA